MDQRAAEIVKDIEDRRLRLGDSLQELETKVRDVADWRTYYQRNPWVALGLALGGGLLLAGLLPGIRNQAGK
jgi:ElaB/YqjD/DUF883 family membrane-anchored ribosome-binding protein